MKENSSSFTAYSKLIKNIDKISESLSENHQSHMKCHKGCDLCCMNYDILPLEFHYILEHLKKEGYKENLLSNTEKDEECVFLNNHTCTIYNNRPLICRTHGLPLLYTNDDYEWELSTCELNFTTYDYENFSPENTFPQDKFNSRLFMLNQKFIAQYKGKKYGERERIPLRNPTEHL
ncbi:MAG: YkgJ family cysteine cluster protein [Mariniphaga sp.]